MLVINKDGLIHNCVTKERYESFKAAGWEDYTPPKDGAGNKTAQPPKDETLKKVEKAE